MEIIAGAQGQLFLRIGGVEGVGFGEVQVPQVYGGIGEGCIDLRIGGDVVAENMVGSSGDRRCQEHQHHQRGEDGQQSRAAGCAAEGRAQMHQRQQDHHRSQTQQDR